MDIAKETTQHIDKLQAFNVSLQEQIQALLNQGVPPYLLQFALHKEIYNLSRTQEEENKTTAYLG